MESEKVKEIKKALENCTSEIPCYKCKHYGKCEKLLTKENILTLINELESENERLNECYKVKAYDKLRAENKKLKDRIAELEKEIEENAFYSKGYAQGIKNTYEVVIPDKLKQFAKRLKEKFYYEGRICRYIIDSDVFDETLKEFING